MSDVKDEEATRSWLSAVDMDAAIIAERRIPEINAGKRVLES